MGIYRTVHEYNIQKSLGVSSTFPVITREEQFVEKITECAIELSERINDCRLVFRCLTMEMKTTEFEILQRSATLKYYIYREKDIIQQALRVYENMKPINDGVRLVGIRVSLLRDRDVCKKERIFGPERQAIIRKYGAGRRQYFLNEDPEEETEAPKNDKCSQEMIFDENFDPNADFTPEEKAQIEKLQKQQKAQQYGGKRKNNCQYQQALYKFCRARMN